MRAPMTHTPVIGPINNYNWQLFSTFPSNVINDRPEEIDTAGGNTAMEYIGTSQSNEKEDSLVITRS